MSLQDAARWVRRRRRGGSARNEGEPLPTFASLLFYFELAGIVLSFGISNNFFFFVPPYQTAQTPLSVATPLSRLTLSLLMVAVQRALYSRRRFFFLSFFPASGLHNTGSNPTLSDLFSLFHPRTLSRSLGASFSAPQPRSLSSRRRRCSSHRPVLPSPPSTHGSLWTTITPPYCPLSYIVNERSSEGTGVEAAGSRKTRRADGWTDKDGGGIKFLITLQCQWKKKCEKCARKAWMLLPFPFFVCQRRRKYRRRFPVSFRSAFLSLGVSFFPLLELSPSP